jgi:hypothetical protein
MVCNVANDVAGSSGALPQHPAATPAVPPCAAQSARAAPERRWRASTPSWIGPGSGAYTHPLNVSTICGIRWVHDFPPVY